MGNLISFTAISRRLALQAAPLTLAAAGICLSQAQAANTTLPQGQAQTAAIVETMPLAAHRAVYDLTLQKAIGSKSPTSAHGRIAFDFTGSACEGYVQNFRQLTELQPAEGPTRVSDMRSLTFEDGEGRNFTFKTRTSVDNEQTDEVDGRAQRPPQGPVSVDLVKPKAAKLDFDHDVLFPTEHLKYIVAAGKAGKNILEVKVYDGSDNGDKIYSTTTIIGKPIASPAADKTAHIPQLEGMQRWPVTISYFDEGRKDEAPNYILSFDLYENGISSALRLDYGDFVLAGEMTSLELLPQSTTCPK
jgi:EipB-like